MSCYENNNCVIIHYTLLPEVSEFYVGHQNQYHCECCRLTGSPRRYCYYLLTVVHQEATQSQPMLFTRVYCSHSLWREFCVQRCEQCNHVNQQLDCITEFGRSQNAHHRLDEPCPYKYLNKKCAR